MSFLKEFEYLKIQLQAIISATNDFARYNCIGEGGFGEVYKGELVLSNKHTTVALKRLGSAVGQGNREFWNEILMLSVYKHENLVSLLGFCDDKGEKILVYEYASRRSLDLYLDNKDLTWVQRLKICIGAARGIAYLHDPAGTQQRVLHRDIKSSNILLDQNWNAKIADMGLSKFGPANQQRTFFFSNAVGTVGYCDPLYIESGFLTKESDVYSFGVVLFEVLCGRLCVRHKNENQPLTKLVRNGYKDNNLDKLIYGGIKDEINPSSLKAFTTVAYRCLKRDRGKRPLMNDIVIILEAALRHQVGLEIANNCEIMLRNLNISPPDIINAICALDSSAINVDQVNDLIKIFPTRAEMEMLKSYTGDKEMLGLCEQFFLECTKIPRIKPKLRVFAFTITFSSQVNNLRESLNTINVANKEILESTKLEKLMRIILSLLDAKVFRGSAARFKLNSFWKLHHKFTSKPSLLHMLCQTVADHDPELLDFYQDLIHLQSAYTINVKSLYEDKSAIIKGYEKVQQEFDALANEDGVSARFREALKSFLDSADAQLPPLTSFFNEVEQYGRSLVEYFGENLIGCSWKRVISSLVHFIKMFKEASKCIGEVVEEVGGSKSATLLLNDSPDMAANTKNLILRGSTSKTHGIKYI